MPYHHNTSNNVRRNMTNAQGQIAPAGYHYMPDGTLMSDADHAMLYDNKKIIKEFNIDTSNIRAIGESRRFTISGDNGAEFSLEIKNEDSKYYNFNTKAFQTAKARLKNETIKNGVYTGSITFPKVGDDDQYDIYLWADHGTKHSDNIEVRFPDNSIDINSSKGSNSTLVQKVIYQYTDLTLTMSAVSKNSLTAWGSVSVTNDTITLPRDKSVGKIPFSIIVTSAATRAITINSDPNNNDILSSITRTVGSTPDNINGENIYPAVSDTDTVDGAVSSGIKVVMDNNVASKMAVGDKITASVKTDTVDGAVSATGTKIVMDNNVENNMFVGYTVTSTDGHFLNQNVYKVAALNPDGDNVKEFQISPALPEELADGVTLTFNPDINTAGVVTVAALNPDGDNVKEFSMSSANKILDGVTLSFSNRKNYRWPLNNIHNLNPGMSVYGTNVTAGTVISAYNDTTTFLEGEIDEFTVVNESKPALDTLAAKPTMSAGVITTQTGDVIFNNQQLFVLAGDTITIYGAGPSGIKQMTEYDIELSNLKVELQPVSTTTTSAVSNSTSIPVAERSGILDDISVISGIGIDSSSESPLVDSGAGTVSGSGTIVSNIAQTLESGIELTFKGASTTAIISGDIEVKKAGISNLTIYFDLESFLTAT